MSKSDFTATQYTLIYCIYDFFSLSLLPSFSSIIHPTSYSFIYSRFIAFPLLVLESVFRFSISNPHHHHHHRNERSETFQLYECSHYVIGSIFSPNEKYHGEMCTTSYSANTRFPIKDQILFIIAAGILFVLYDVEADTNAHKHTIRPIQIMYICMHTTKNGKSSNFVTNFLPLFIPLKTFKFLKIVKVK